MINRKLIILAIFLVSLLAVSAVSAADNATSDVASAEETTDEVVSINENQVILKESNNVGTFDELSRLIENTSEGGVLELNKSYRYADDSKDGIQINKAITIDGKGHTLDGNKLSRIFYVIADNVALMNINFVNANINDNGGAINWNGNDGKLLNCNFTNCSNIINKKKDFYYGGAIYWNGINANISYCNFIENNAWCTAGIYISDNSENCSVSNCKFIKNVAEYVAGLLYQNSEYGFVNECNFIDNTANFYGSLQIRNSDYTLIKNCNFENNTCKYNDGTFDCSSEEISIINCTFKNNNAYYGGGIRINTDNVFIYDSNFINNYAEYRAGAIGFNGNNIKFINCLCENNSASYGGAIEGYGDLINITNCNFSNNFADQCGAITLDGENNIINYCNFTNNHAEMKSVFELVSSSYNYINNCIFINNSADDWGGVGKIDSSKNCWFNNCTFIDNQGSNLLYISLSKNINFNYCEFYSLKENINFYWTDKSSGTINNNIFNHDYGNIAIISGEVNIIKRNPIINTYFNTNSSLFKYGNASMVRASLTDNIYNLSNKNITLNLQNKYMIKTFILKTNSYGEIFILEELNELNVGNWNMILTFEGNDNYYPCNATAKITVLPQSSSLSIGDVNGTVGHEATLIANVNSNLTVNEGMVTFFDGKNNIGEEMVIDGVAILIYAPTTAGEHNITAVFNSDNYLSSNDTAKLLVDSATVKVLADTGTVGLESTFVANVKGRYSTINEGKVYFYINEEYIGSDSVVNGQASIKYTPLTANNYFITAVFKDSIKFLDCFSEIWYTVNKADSQTTINDINGTVGHEATLTANVISSNKLTINEGTITFFDESTNIGEKNVNNGVATLTYAPTTAGEHKIKVVFNSDNYLSSNDTATLSVAKANVDLSIGDIAPVYFSNPSNFAVTINSNSKAVNEGKIKYYVNNQLVGTDDVSEGTSSINYVANTSGNLTLTVVYDETDNYLASNASCNFQVNKMPTTLTAESVIFDEQESKAFTTELKDDNTNGVSNQTVKIEVIKYSGESATFTGESNNEGITVYDVGNLAGGMWYVSGNYKGNDNYIASRFADKFIVVRVDTTTEIEEISNPQVNHTYKLKANIHDEDGKLVKEGIVQFYLDGVDIGSIDLSKNNGHQDALRSCLLGDGEDDEPYLEYTPTETGNFKLSAVYEGTTIYKSSNSTTDFIVKNGAVDTTLSAPDVTTFYNEGKDLVATLKDADGNVINGAKVKIVLGDVTKTLTTDNKGQVSLTTDGLVPNTYAANIAFDGDSIYSPTNATAKVVINKASTKLVAKYEKGNVVATVKDANGNPVSGLKVGFALNGMKYVTTDANGEARYSVTDLAAGNYTVKVLAYGNDLYEDSNQESVVVKREQAKIYLRNALYFVLQTKYVTVTLWDANNNPIANKTVYIKLNDNSWKYSGVTDENGNALIKVGVGFGNHPATISFEGDDEYTAVSKVGRVRVIKETPSLMLPGAYTKFKASDSTKTIKVYLKDRYNKPLLKDTKVFVTINGKQYVGQINTEGIATININLNNVGTYNVDLYYTGNTAYNAVRKSTKITIV